VLPSVPYTSTLFTQPAIVPQDEMCMCALMFLLESLQRPGYDWGRGGDRATRSSGPALGSTPFLIYISQRWLSMVCFVARAAAVCIPCEIQVTARLFMGKGRRRSSGLQVPLSARDDDDTIADQWAALRQAFLAEGQVSTEYRLNGSQVSPVFPFFRMASK